MKVRNALTVLRSRLEPDGDPWRAGRRPCPCRRNAPGRSPRCASVPMAAQALGHRSESWAPNASLPLRRNGREQSGAFSRNSSQGGSASGRRQRSAQPGPTFRPAPRRSSSPGSGFPVLNHRTSPKSGPQDPVSASVTSAARDLCPGRKRKRAGLGAPTPCRGGPSWRARDFLQVHVHPGAGGQAPRARTCSAQPSGALRTAGRLGAARWCGPRAQWEPTGGRGDSAGPASERPLVWRGPGAECGGGGLAQTRRAPGAC